MSQATAKERSSEQAAHKSAIRPFHVDVPELRRRINATKWPQREIVTDASQGVQLATTPPAGFFPREEKMRHA